MNLELKIERVEIEQLAEVFDFLEAVFSIEQGIEKDLIPLPFEEQHWWCIKIDERIVATVAAWKDGAEWHWGRLAVDKRRRGLGLGRKIASESLSVLFNSGIDEIVIDARDITVTLLQSFGGKITGKTHYFSGHPITPMLIEKEKFIQSSQHTKLK
ncbi:GNAT family N-acetyltransferase [Ekhidna sp.]|uniref:GNAT family N-acetyltransferase n=1 Tax=Ekhidna sp. TaxID=2608089 RepID=UPI003BA8B3EA